MKKFIEIFRTLKRKIILFALTEGAGKIKIEKDRILCQVKKRTLNYTFRQEKSYGMCLEGYDSIEMSDEDREFFETRPIYYIFEDMNFDKGVNVETFFDVNVVFKNCTFSDYINLSCVSNITFESNKYLYDESIDSRSIDCKDKYFLTGTGKKIKFINDKLGNGRKDAKVSSLGMNINFDDVEIVDSSISFGDEDSDKKIGEGELSIKAKNLILDDAVIECSSMKLDCDNVIYNESSVIDVKRKIEVNNKNNSFDVNSAYAPTMIYNGSIIKEKEVVGKEVVSARQKLIGQLKAISEVFANINRDNIIKAEEKINNRAIGRIKRR